MISDKPAILIVDDDEEICHLIDESLVDIGFRCEIALTAEDAINKIGTYSFDAVLLDIKLPDKSGIEVLRLFGTAFPSIAIVMLTALSDVDTVVKAMQLGASDYIVKPFTIAKLNATVSAAIKKMSSDTGLTRPQNRDIIRNENASSACLSEISAMAYGVDAQVDYFDFHSRVVTERTICLARQFGFADRDIQEWAHLRKERLKEREKYLDSIFSKLERSPIVQMLLGLTDRIYKVPKLGNGRN